MIQTLNNKLLMRVQWIHYFCGVGGGRVLSAQGISDYSANFPPTSPQTEIGSRNEVDESQCQWFFSNHITYTIYLFSKILLSKQYKTLFITVFSKTLHQSHSFFTILNLWNEVLIGNGNLSFHTTKIPDRLFYLI